MCLWAVWNKYAGGALVAAVLLFLWGNPLQGAGTMMVVRDTVLPSGSMQVEVQVWGSTKDATSGYSISLCYNTAKVLGDSVSSLGTIWDPASAYYQGFNPFFYLGTPDNDTGFVAAGCIYFITGDTVPAFVDPVPLASVWFTIDPGLEPDSACFNLGNWCNGSGTDSEFAGAGATIIPLDEISGGCMTFEGVSVNEDATEFGPHTFQLFQNHPNPVYGRTTIRFAIPERSPVTLALYNASGRKLATLVNGVLNTGTHEIAWEGQDRSGRQLPGGVYFYRLSMGEKALQQKLLLLE